MRGLFETEGRSPRSMVWWLLPITDYKTVRMKLSVLGALALVLTASVTRTHVPDPRVASLAR